MTGPRTGGMRPARQLRQGAGEPVVDLSAAQREQITAAIALGVDGDSIQVRLVLAIAGIGDKGDVLTVVQDPIIDAMLAAGWLVLYTGPGPAPLRPRPLSTGPMVLSGAELTNVLAYLDIPDDIADAATDADVAAAIAAQAATDSGTYVSPLSAQSFTAAQQRQARSNTGAGPVVRGLKLAALGDSITARNTTTGGGADTVNLPGGYVNQTIARSMGRINLGGNFGVGGNTISDMLGRISNVVAVAPDVCVVLGGTNDVSGSATDSALLAAVESLFTQGHDVLKAAGILPVVCTIPPRTSTDTSDMTRQRGLVNSALTHLARLRGYPLVDFYSRLVDPTTGKYPAANLYDLDGTHPNDVGSRRMADALIAVLGDYLPNFTPALSTWNGDPTNLAPNGLFIGGSSLVSGSPMPTGWTGGSSSTRRIVAGDTSDLLAGSWFEVAIDAATAPTIGAQQVAGNIATGFSVGDALRFSCRVQVDGFDGGASSSTGTHYVSTRIRFNGPGTIVEPMYQWKCDIADGLIVYDVTVPTGTTSIDLLVALSGQGIPRWGQVTLRNLTTSGVGGLT